MSVIDLSVLPAPDVIEQLNYETLLSSFLADFLSLLPPEMRPAAEATLTLESEPVTKLAEAIAYRDMLIRQRMNDLYVKYTGRSLTEIEKALDRDTFLEAEEAMKFGIVDKVFETRPEGEANPDPEGSGGAPE